MIIVKIAAILLLYYVQTVLSVTTCKYYPDGLYNAIGIPTLCADYCCNKTGIPTKADDACCGSVDLGLWWIAIGCAIGLVVCIILLILCCCCKCIKKCCCPCC